MSLTSLRVAILTADDGIERVELTAPRRALEDAGAQVCHVTPTGGEARTFDQAEPSARVTADAALGGCDPADFDALVLPGGFINPDKLRQAPGAIKFTRHFFDAGKPVGVICHGPWVLIEADAVGGRTLTAVGSLRTDIRNAGGEWVDEPVHVDAGNGNLLISGRDHDAVEPFAEALVRELGARSPAADTAAG
jgi:protease I